MSEKPISPMRRRMIEDMTVRNFVEKTHNDYIRHVRTFTAFLGRAPDTAAPEDLRLFQLHQTQAGVRKGKGGRKRRGITRPKGRATRASARASPVNSHEIPQEARKIGDT